MKVGIVTFHEAANYGAVLQAYALQEAVKELGATPSFISCTPLAPAPPPEPPELLARLQKFPRLREEREKMKVQRGKRNALFSDFRQRLSISPSYTAEQLPQLNAVYDTFITGSDQVWNYEIIGRNPFYFLDFAHRAKRFSYAASFGLHELPKQLHGWYAEHLLHFAQISVREASGQKLVAQLLQRQAHLCLDPVFLLDAHNWKKLALSARADGHGGGQLFLYLVDLDKRLLRLAGTWAAQTHREVKIVTASLQGPLPPETWCGTGVAEFVADIAQASLVLTDSFHGLALAIIFGKDFYVSDRVLESPRGSRLAHLLALTGLSARRADNAPAPAIDWHDVHDRLARQRQLSLQYLRDIVT